MIPLLVWWMSFDARSHGICVCSATPFPVPDWRNADPISVVQLSTIAQAGTGLRLSRISVHGDDGPGCHCFAKKVLVTDIRQPWVKSLVGVYFPSRWREK